MTQPTIRCGFIGLGSQGAPIAERIIAAGFPIWLWARRPEALERFAGPDVHAAATVADLARAVDHVGVCVVNDADVREVCDALLPALAPGARLAIHSTVHPNTVRAVADQGAARGVQVIDAPVSGGEPAARAGTLTLMLGGEAAAIAEARPVFDTFGQLIVHLGAVGAGQHAKLVNNSLLAANMAVADRALAAADALGIDKASLLQLLAASSGRSFGLEVRGRLSTASAFAHGGPLLLKDIELLRAVLPADPGAQGLWDTAREFLFATVGRSAAS